MAFVCPAAPLTDIDFSAYGHFPISMLPYASSVFPYPYCLALSFVGLFQRSWNYLSATGGGWVVWDLGSPHSVLAVFIMVYLKVSSNGCNGFNTFNTRKKA